MLAHYPMTDSLPDASSGSLSHTPVLCALVMEALAPQENGLYLDGTFGRGGHARAILAAASGCRVIGVDRDPAAVEAGLALARESGGRFRMVEGAFGDMAAHLEALGETGLDGVLLDLGVSSPQLDDVARGFSFRGDGPLDMRMGRQILTAADLVNTLPERELARIIFELGEERMARKVARAIAMAREEEHITRTGQLASLVRRVVQGSRDGIDPATRTFQALRMEVNDELGELARGLAAAETLLNPGGRLAVITFHSLEDREVKEFLRRRAGYAPGPSRHMPFDPNARSRRPTFRLLTRRPLEADDDECARNPRARSARLRVAERLGSAGDPWARGSGQGTGDSGDACNEGHDEGHDEEGGGTPCSTASR